MSKILVIEPYKMLQQAIAVSLFPEYETLIAASVPDVSPLDDIVAVIVDAASLRETDGLAAESMRSLRRWNLPMVWIDGGDSSLVPGWDNLVAVERAVGKAGLRDAVAACLGEFMGGRGQGTARTQGQEKRPPRTAGPDEAMAKSSVIDLVDIVDEAPKRQKRAVPEKIS